MTVTCSTPTFESGLTLKSLRGTCTAAQALERRGELVSAMREYRAAEALYQGEFLEEDRYEDWLVPQRQRPAR